MFGNMSYQVLDIIARGKREQDLGEVAKNSRSQQFAQSQDQVSKPLVPQENAPRGPRILRFLRV